MRESAQRLARPLVASFEGCHLVSYVFPNEHWATVGFGRAIPLAHHPLTITQEQADQNLLEDLARKDAQLCKEIPGAVLLSLTDDQYAAILSFRFNVKDSAWLSPNCNTRKALVAGNLTLFRAKLKQWNKGEGSKVLGGLQRRRKCERFVLAGGKMSELPGLHYFQNNYAIDNF